MNLRKVLTLFLTLCMFFSFSSVAFTKNCVGNDDLTEAEKNNPRTNLCIPEGEEVPPEYNLPKPEELFAPHPDIPPISTDDSASALAVGDGTNNISFASFTSGDIICVNATSFSATSPGHTGEWDGYYYSSSNLDKPCIWSAQKTLNKVLLEPPSKYHNYDVAYGLWVPSLSYYVRSNARNYCRNQSGEPYYIYSSKTDQTRWYCSKLAWASFYYNVNGTHESADPDLDADGGYWVWPVDLINDSQVSIFAYSN